MKERIDVLLVEKGLVRSREKAKAALMAGIVFVDGKRVDKAGTRIDVASGIEVRGKDCPYVGRGGFKLKKAIDAFGISLKDYVCVDMGSSTGGFTDCMLQEGAAHVFAVDVGYGQLDYSLRVDERVTVMEKTNIRYMDPDSITPLADFVSVDVSFISTSLIFPKAAEVTREDALMVSLIKPQFEAGREQVGKKGIVRDQKVHEEVIKKVLQYGRDNGFAPKGVTFSPIKGTKGNIEYLALFQRGGTDTFVENIANIVLEAHAMLKTLVIEPEE